MAFTVQMPALGESVTEGTVTRWLKQEGDRVEVDEPLLEVSTDKVDTEIPSPAAGVLERIVAGEDETVEVGGDLAVIGDGDGGGSDDGGSAKDEQQDEQDQPDDEQDEEPPAPSESDDSTSGADSGDGGSGGSDAPQYPNTADEPAAEAGSDTSSDSGESSKSGGAPGKGGGAKKGGGGTPVTMPELGESVTEGVITRWLKQVGDTVEVDEPLLEVSTDKVDTEIPSPVAGTLLSISADEDETVQVGAELAVVGDESDVESDGGSDDSDESDDAAGADDSGDRSGSDQTTADSGADDSAPTDDAPAAERDAEAPQGQEPMAEGSSGDASGAETADADERAERQEVTDTQPDRPSSGSDGDGSSDRDGGSGGDGRSDAPYVTPLVRKLAAQHEVDLATVSGSGVGGRIRKQDVLAAADKATKDRDAAQKDAQKDGEKPDTEKAGEDTGSEKGGGRRPTPSPAKGAPEPGTTVKMPRLRQVIAQRMTESLRVSAQLTTVQEVDVTRIARLRTRAKAEFERREGVKLTYLPFFAKATVEALKQYPQLNASINEESREVVYHGHVHLAIAVDTPRGLLVPVIENADELNIAGLARHIADLAARTRDNKVGPKELSGGTFTITNIGSSGALFDTPIINQPQVAILGTGAISKEPKVVAGPDGEDVIAVRSVCYLPLTYDHRLVDGADAGRFVSAIRERLEEGAFEADLGL